MEIRPRNMSKCVLDVLRKSQRSLQNTLSDRLAGHDTHGAQPMHGGAEIARPDIARLENAAPD